MIISRSPSQHTRDSIHALVARQMADLLVENVVDLGDIDACRSELTRANFGRPAIDALLERACENARLDMVA
ncbi:hypothetical protein F9K87_16110 [Brucella anthropi]|uniref:hypothetical protein n=1 Tax=Brucella anthropi TaxID=529 RepID=UPI00124F746D|nr:hypothetical protein [Brucella anthropi]KAB2795926.1 hypothetical protein F9K87_16110 [Brucella anthropi]